MKKIIFYETNSGNSPAQEFIDSLSDKQAKKVAWVLRWTTINNFNKWFSKEISENTAT